MKRPLELIRVLKREQRTVGQINWQDLALFGRMLIGVVVLGDHLVVLLESGWLLRHQGHCAALLGNVVNRFACKSVLVVKQARLFYLLSVVKIAREVFLFEKLADLGDVGGGLALPLLHGTLAWEDPDLAGNVKRLVYVGCVGVVGGVADFKSRGVCGVKKFPRQSR